MFVSGTRLGFASGNCLGFASGNCLGFAGETCPQLAKLNLLVYLSDTSCRPTIVQS